MILRALLVGVFLASGLACGDAPCANHERVTVKVDGTCGSGPQAVTIVDYGCNLKLEDASGYLGLPLTGALGESGAVRRGGWMLWGDVCPESGPCEGRSSFRFCQATRVDWWLELACLDQAGQRVCEALMRE